MHKLTVLGAGYMGSAICCPLSEKADQINLWGTWLDGELLDAARNGEHPRIRKVLPPNIQLFDSEQLADALEGSELVIVAVSSEGFVPVFERLLEVLDPEIPLLTITKGFINEDGVILRISEYAEREFEAKFPGKIFRWGSIGGPVKAVELADRIPTHSVYGLNRSFPRKLLENISNAYYRVSVCGDVIGVETCSAFKNAYAIALGICDGAYGGGERYYDNIKSFFIAEAAREMAEITELAGGLAATANYLAGTGDVYVTAQSGRNKVFGSLIGEGISPAEAIDKMNRAGDIAEGYHSVEYGRIFLEQRGRNVESGFPLLFMLHSIIFGGTAFSRAFEGFISAFGI